MIREKVDDETWSRIDMVLEEIENSLPYQQIYIDKSQNKIDEEFDENQISEIKSKAHMLISMAKATGNTNLVQVIEVLFSSEPFCKCPEVKQQLLEEYK